MTTTTNDEELSRHAARAYGRVVLITGQEARVHDPTRRTSVYFSFSYLYIYRWCCWTSSTRSMKIHGERIRTQFCSCITRILSSKPSHISRVGGEYCKRCDVTS
jgi:hypothetical protein